MQEGVYFPFMSSPTRAMGQPDKVGMVLLELRLLLELWLDQTQLHL